MSGSLRKSLGVSLVVLSTLVTVTDAAAQGEDTPSTPVSKLPTARLLMPPTAKAPAAISARERVPGFVLAAPKGRGDYVTLVSSTRAAKQLFEGAVEDGPGPREACFSDDAASAQRLRFGGEQQEPESAWRSNMQHHLLISSGRGDRPRVIAVHSERIAEESGRASLEVIDAWVDTSTRGVRVIARASVPLQLVAGVLGGTKVYAAHDGQSVHVILARPADQQHGRIGSDPLFAIADNSLSSSSCDHIGVTMKSEKNSGHTANFISTVELPSLAPKEPEAPAPKPESDSSLAARRVGREARVRPVHVQASVMWTSRDAEPVLTVSAGWDSRERTTVVF